MSLRDDLAELGKANEAIGFLKAQADMLALLGELVPTTMTEGELALLSAFGTGVQGLKP